MYTLTIEVRDVADGDITDLAQRIWDAHAAELDAARGDFTLRISKDGFPFDWEPSE
jgi:hypothetical protein